MGNWGTEWWSYLFKCSRVKNRSASLKSHTRLLLLCWFIPSISLTFLAVMIHEYNLLLALPWFFWLQNEVVYAAGECAKRLIRTHHVSRAFGTCRKLPGDQSQRICRALCKDTVVLQVCSPGPDPENRIWYNGPDLMRCFIRACCH